MPHDHTARNNPALRGRECYEADVALNPVYHDGMTRRTWDELDSVQQSSWEKPRREYAAPSTELTASGEQYVIPGAEKRHAPGSEDEQLDLW